jgi:hypothetical protein
MFLGLDPTIFEVLYFVSVWVVSSFVLLVSAKVFGAKAGFLESMIASLLGSAVFYFFRGNFLFSLAATIIWLLVLKFSFRVGWVRALLISMVAYVLAWLVSLLLGIPMLP